MQEAKIWPGQQAYTTMDGFEKETDAILAPPKEAPKRNVWHIVAALSGFISILFSTHEAHAYSPTDASYHEIYRRGTQLHLFYSLMIMLSPMARRTKWVAGFCIFGIICFSGACYTTAITENYKFAMTAPIGGTSFMAAWLAWIL